MHRAGPDPIGLHTSNGGLAHIRLAIALSASTACWCDPTSRPAVLVNRCARVDLLRAASIEVGGLAPPHSEASDLITSLLTRK